MEPGVFAKIFARPSLEETLDAVADQGLHFIQFNLVSAGLPPLATLYVATFYGARKKGLNKSRRGAVSESRYLTTLTTSENFPPGATCDPLAGWPAVH